MTPRPLTQSAIARSHIAAHDEMERLRADAQAAVAALLQEAEEACRYLHVVKTEARHGPWNSAVLQCCEMLRALAPTDGLALVAELRAERDMWRANYEARTAELATIAAMTPAEQSHFDLTMRIRGAAGGIAKKQIAAREDGE